MKKLYQPSQKILENYANILVNFALNNGNGIKKGEVIRVSAEESAKPLYAELRKAVWRAGGHVLGNYIPESDEKYNFERDFFTYTSDEQVKFFPAKLSKALIEQIDHSIMILSDSNPQALKGIDPKRIMMQGEANKPAKAWRDEKENKGKFTWTLALYGTPAMAKEAGLSLEAYWKQIIDACFLEEKDPIAKWKQVYVDMEKTRKALNKLSINKLHIQGKDADLFISMGEKRKWVGGSGRNIPSFELFTSPDWRGTEGWIKFNQPLYRYGTIIKGIELHFKNGKVIKSSATENEKVLKEMIATPNADKIGEYSLTDKRFSRITKFMAETLFDENIGGPNGNTHLALGSSYHDCFDGNPANISKQTWAKLGFNDSSVHTDIISTAPRIVTAYLTGGSTKVIYKDGMFTV